MKNLSLTAGSLYVVGHLNTPSSFFFFVSSSPPHFSIVLPPFLANFPFAIFVFSTFFCIDFQSVFGRIDFRGIGKKKKKEKKKEGKLFEGCLVGREKRRKRKCVVGPKCFLPRSTRKLRGRKSLTQVNQTAHVHSAHEHCSYPFSLFFFHLCCTYTIILAKQICYFLVCKYTIFLQKKKCVAFLFY